MTTTSMLGKKVSHSRAGFSVAEPVWALGAGSVSQARSPPGLAMKPSRLIAMNTQPRHVRLFLMSGLPGLGAHRRLHTLPGSAGGGGCEIGSITAMTFPECMTAVRVIGHGGPEVLEVAEVPVPAPQAGEVLVKVHAVALNNTDLWTREGAYGLPDDPAARAGWRGPIDFPRIQGADVAGGVAATGTGVDERLIGCRVVIDPAMYDAAGPDANPVGLMGSERDGGYAQSVCAPATQVHDVTGSPLTDGELATFPTAYGTALGMIERGRVRAGETVLVTGASGGVGLALVQLARDRGARVLAVSSGTKLTAVAGAGAHVVLDRGRALPEQVRRGAGDGLDVVLDVVVGDFVDSGLPFLRSGVTVVVSGAHDVHTV